MQMTWAMDAETFLVWRALPWWRRKWVLLTAKISVQGVVHK
jgi:hypothetical protein